MCRDEERSRICFAHAAPAFQARGGDVESAAWRERGRQRHRQHAPVPRLGFTQGFVKRCAFLLLPNFGGLFLGCIEADFCDQIVILQHF